MIVIASGWNNTSPLMATGVSAIIDVIVVSPIGLSRASTDLTTASLMVEFDLIDCSMKSTNTNEFLTTIPVSETMPVIAKKLIGV